MIKKGDWIRLPTWKNRGYPNDGWCEVSHIVLDKWVYIIFQEETYAHLLYGNWEIRSKTKKLKIGSRIKGRSTEGTVHGIVRLPGFDYDHIWVHWDTLNYMTTTTSESIETDHWAR